MKLPQKLGSVYDNIITLLFIITGLLILFMAAIVTVNITLRTFTNTSIPGTIEISEWILLLIPFLGAPWLLKQDGHVRMDIVLQMLKNKKRCILNMVNFTVISLICLLFFFYIALNTWTYYITEAYRPSVLSLPTYIFSGIMAAGFLFIAIQAIRNVFGYMDELKREKKVLEESNADIISSTE